jgi:Tol biopolymer transport system component
MSREELKDGERQALDAHLFICATCRTYGRKIAMLEEDVSRTFHNRLDLIATPVDMAGKVQARLVQSKTRMQAFRLAGSLAGALALVGLLLVLSEGLLGTRLEPASPSTGSEEAILAPEEVQPSAPASVPGGRWIAFTSLRDGNEEIYIMPAPLTASAVQVQEREDDSAQTNLTNHPASDNLPTWSPDGQRLAFVSDRSGKPEVYIMLPDGTGLSQVTYMQEAEGIWSLSWSPDGTRLAAEVMLLYPVTGELYGRIYLIHADGSGVKELTQNEVPVVVFSPRWSPAGDWIAYMQGGIAPTYLRLTKPDGTGDKALVRSIRNVLSIAWSPDGSHLAYATSCHYCDVLNDDEPDDLRLVSLDGLEEDTLFRFEDRWLEIFGLSWSPDGSYLAFTASMGKEPLRRLFLFEFEAKELAEVAVFDAGDWQIGVPTWSPEGTQLVFDYGGEDERDIYILDIKARLQGDESPEMTSLTTGSPGRDYQPQWQP